MHEKTMVECECQGKTIKIKKRMIVQFYKKRVSEKEEKVV